VNCCPSNLLSDSTLPPLTSLPCVNTVYTYSVCSGGGYGVLGLRQINICREVPLHVNFFRLQHFALPSMSLIFHRYAILIYVSLSFAELSREKFCPVLRSAHKPLRCRTSDPAQGKFSTSVGDRVNCLPVLGIWFRIRRIRMFLCLQDLDPLVRVTDPAPDPSCFGSFLLFTTYHSYTTCHFDFPALLRMTLIPAYHYMKLQVAEIYTSASILQYYGHSIHRCCFHLFHVMKSIRVPHSIRRKEEE